MQNMIWYLLWAIAPLIPAVLIYKVMPKSRSTVGGVFQGLQIKLGSAAALYFLIFFTMNPMKLGFIDRESVQDNWTVIATFQDEKNRTVSTEQLVKVEAIPDVIYEKLDRRKIQVSLPYVNVDKDKYLSIPYKLRFIFNEYDTESITSSEYFNSKENCNVKWKEREIHLKNLPKLVAKRMVADDTTGMVPADEIVIN